MVKQQAIFILREIDEKTADDPKRERTYYKFTPDSVELDGQVEIKVKSKEVLDKLGLPEHISDSVNIEFGVKNKQSSLPPPEE